MAFSSGGRSLSAGWGTSYSISTSRGNASRKSVKVELAFAGRQPRGARFGHQLLHRRLVGELLGVAELHERELLARYSGDFSIRATGAVQMEGVD